MLASTPIREPLRGVAWSGALDDGALVLLDQTRLPGSVTYLSITELEVLREAIVALRVRGAPAIGIAGAYGIVVHLVPLAKARLGERADVLESALEHAVERLGSSRPTAVNLRWALDRMRECFHRHASHLATLEMCARLLMEAKRIHREDAELCQRIAENGAAVLPKSGGVYTHCNTGALATGGVGTAIGCLVEAVRQGKWLKVYAGETRPLLQGARLTAPELRSNGVDVTLVCDSFAGSLMSRGLIKAVIVGADRICANGDTANKIGTYGLAVLAKHHRIPFHVAAPYSTFDLTLKSGAEIPIEERHADEVRKPQGASFTPDDMTVVNPAFDVTPGELITSIITERGVITSPSRATIKKLMGARPGEPAV